MSLCLNISTYCEKKKRFGKTSCYLLDEKKSFRYITFLTNTDNTTSYSIDELSLALLFKDVHDYSLKIVLRLPTYKNVIVNDLSKDPCMDTSDT